MTTRSVLTIVGQYIGGMYGGTFGAAIGGMIGGAIGGAIDPETIQGPKLGDAQMQTARDGVPRPIVYGIGPIVGNLIDRSELQIVVVGERQGKAGTTPIVEHDEAYMTYAMRICEGPIIGVRRIWENEKLVYDAAVGPDVEDAAEDPDGIAILVSAHSSAQAGNNKFMVNKRLYLGDEDQLPDSALEAIHGVGNVPAYRGTAYIVFEHENLTKSGGAIPTYRFEVIGRGNAGDRVVDSYDVPHTSGFRKAHWPLLDDESAYTLVGNRFSNEFAPLTNLTGDTVEEIIAQAAMYGSLPTQYLGYAARDEETYGFDLTGETYDPTNVEKVYLIYNIPVDVLGYLTYLAYGAGGTICGATTNGLWLCDRRGALVTKAAQVGFVYPGPYETFQDCDATSAVVGSYPLVITATRKKQCDPVGGYARPRHARLPVLIPDSSDFAFDFDSGTLMPVPSSVATVSASFHVLQNEASASATWGTYYTAFDVGPAIISGDERYNSQTYWEYEYAQAVAAGQMPAGLTYGVDYPVAKASACRIRSTFYEVAPDGLYLYEIVDDVCDRVGIGADERDTSELTDIVLGYVCARQMNGAEAIRATQGAYLFDMPEFDAKIRGVKRGGASAVTLTEDDLVWTGDDSPTELLVRDQAVEYPRKVHVISYDPITSYVPTKETAERSSANVEAVSEVTLQLALTLEHDERKQIADRTLKIAWAEAQGTVQFSVPDYLSKYTASDVFFYGGRRWRIDRVQTFDGYQTFECRADRQSAYTSTLTGSQPAEPTTPPLGVLAGPTLLSVMNIPAQQESDEVSGVYVAVAGMLPGWQGAMVQMSTDGGATWANVQAIRTQTPQGSLTTALADESGSPSDNDFGVRVYGGDLESASASQVSLGANRGAVSDDEGQTWEILSFETATETAEHDYTLSELERGLDGTAPLACAVGDFFCLLTNLVFVPLDEALDGQTILFRAVTLGTSEDTAYEVAIVYHLQDVVWDGGRV